MSHSSSPVLVVDKVGLLGRDLAQRLQETYLTVFVSSQTAVGTNIIPVSFHKKIPTIPDNSFSHIFLVYSGEKELEEALPSFIRKAQQTKAQLILITSLFHYRDSIAQKLFTLYDNAQVVVTGDVFTETVELPSSPINSFLFHAKMYGHIELANTGLDLVFPIFIRDVIDGIMAIAFIEGQSKQVYAALPRHPYTQLSFVRMLQKLYPLLHVDFTKHKVAAPHYHLPSSALPIFEEYPVEKRLRLLDLTHTPLASNTQRAREAKQALAHKPKRPILFILSLFLFILSLPFLFTIGSAVTGGLLLQQAEKELTSGKLVPALASTQAASSFLSLADDSATTLRSIVSFVGLSHEAIGFQTMIHTGREVASASNELLTSAVQFEKLLNTNGPIAKDDYLDVVNQLKQGMNSLQAIQAEESLPAAYKERFSRIQDQLSLASSLIDASPELLGFYGKRQYLVLFQNNFELRPGGGFIGSYGLATFDRGHLDDLTIHDVYTADGKLKAHIDPPFALKRYMTAPHWFLRDSNFDPDFTESASQAAAFLKLEVGENVDGVIGIDVTFLSSLLDATGPLKVPDYKETLTKDNFYLITQSHAENNFFPGSTQKQDFLRSAEEALLTKIKNRQFSYSKFASAVTTALLEKHVVFSFPDAAMQKLFDVNNLSASLKEQREKSPATLLDTVGVNEANIGQNKSNYYLTRSLAQKVTIDGEGIVNEELTLTYTNTSKKASPFGGDYKAYLRLITPAGTTLTGIRIDAVDQTIIPAITNENVYQAAIFKAPKGVEVDESVEKGRKLFGFLFSVPQSQTKKITLSYRLEQRAPVDTQEWHYASLAIKQPGTLTDKYSLTVNYPLASRLLKSSLPVSDLGGKLVFDSTLSQDRSLKLTFISR